MLNQFFKTSVRKKADQGVAFQFVAIYSGQTTFKWAIAKNCETITPLQCHLSTALSLTTSSSSTQPRHIAQASVPAGHARNTSNRSCPGGMQVKYHKWLFSMRRHGSSILSHSALKSEIGSLLRETESPKTSRRKLISSARICDLVPE